MGAVENFRFARHKLAKPASPEREGYRLIAPLAVLCPLIAIQFKRPPKMRRMKIAAMTAIGSLAIPVANAGVSAKHRAIPLKENEHEQSRLHIKA